MGEKDIAERTFMELDDVFADIFYGLLFQGRQVVKPEALITARTASQYKADNGRLREQERDISKVWDCVRFKVCLAGEAQTKPDRDAPFRVISYDGSSYRSQLLKKERRTVNGEVKLVPCKERYPVITLILYFGEKPWNYPKNLMSCFRPKLPDNEVTQILKNYISDYKINVIDISSLDAEAVSLFRSDFRLVADYFVNSRTNSDYRPDGAVIQHVDEFLKLMSVLTGDSRYEEIGVELSEEDRKAGISMCKVLDYREARGEARGEAKGEDRLARLVRYLINNDKNEELELAISNRDARKEMYIKYGI